MDVRSIRVAGVVLFAALQLMQLGAGVAASKAPCCCRGAMCPMKMHCASRSCTLAERPVSPAPVRAVVAPPATLSASVVVIADDVALPAPVRDGFTRLDEQPPRAASWMFS